MLRLFHSEFARETMFVNKLLGYIRLRLCKDCQKLTSAFDLRCGKCRIEHDEYMKERLMQEAQDDLRAEYEAENNDEHDPNWSDQD